MRLHLVPGGDSIGIELDYQGVVITGGYEVKTTDGTSQSTRKRI